MRMRLILEEYSPELIYIKGSENIVADALSHLDKIDNVNNENNNKIESSLESLREHFAFKNENILHPTNFKTIMRFQQKDKSLIDNAKDKPKDYFIKQFHGAGKAYSLINRYKKPVIPKQLQKSFVEWYCSVLCHLGKTRTELAIGQHFYWKGLQKSIHDICSKCHMYQFVKRGKRNYFKLPPKQAKTQQ